MPPLVSKAVIPIAGLGKRFLPLTKSVPKELLPLIDTPVVQYVVEEAVQSGIKDIIFVSSPLKHSVEDYFDISQHLQMNINTQPLPALKELLRIANQCQFFTVKQIDPLGLGHAVACAAPLLGEEPFALLLPDEVIDGLQPCIAQLINVYEKYQANVIGIFSIPVERSNLYGMAKGVWKTDQLLQIEELQEKPPTAAAYSHYAIAGRYILSPKIFSCLQKTTPGRLGEIQLTDALNLLLSQESVYGYVFEGNRFDTGEKLGWLEANIAFALKKPEFEALLKKVLKKYLI